MLGPFEKERKRGRERERERRGPQAAKLETRPLAPRETHWPPTPLGRQPRLHGYPLRTLAPAPQSRGPRDQHVTDAEARPRIQVQPMGGYFHRLLYPDARFTQLQPASLIKHRLPQSRAWGACRPMRLGAPPLRQGGHSGPRVSEGHPPMGHRTAGWHWSQPR